MRDLERDACDNVGIWDVESGEFCGERPNADCLMGREWGRWTRRINFAPAEISLAGGSCTFFGWGMLVERR